MEITCEPRPGDSTHDFLQKQMESIVICCKCRPVSVTRITCHRGDCPEITERDAMQTSMATSISFPNSRG